MEPVPTSTMRALKTMEKVIGARETSSEGKGVMSSFIRDANDDVTDDVAGSEMLLGVAMEETL